MTFSLQKTFYAMTCAAGLLIVLFFGRPILVPLAISLLVAFILYPMCSRIESWGVGRVTATMLCMLGVTILLAGTVYLFSSQIVGLASEFSDFGNKLNELIDTVITYVNKNINLVPDINEDKLKDQGEALVKESGGVIVTGTLNQTMDILSGLLMIMVYTFLLLIYRSGLKHVAQQFASEENREKVSQMINEMQSVGQSYLFGMAVMIGILGTANSIILLLFGIDNAIFFGFLAALLAIIPYVGTALGAMIPVTYAFMTNDSLLVPLGVMIAFWFVQLVESNYLSPKIVGGNLNINALAAIISLIIGGYLWGVAGMVVFLPLTAIFKVYCSYYEPLKPLGMLLGVKLYNKKYHKGKKGNA